MAGVVGAAAFVIVVVMVRNSFSKSGLLLNLDLRAGAVTSSRKAKVHGTSTPHRPPVGACVRRYRNKRVQMNSDQVDTVSKPLALVVMSTHLWLGLHLQCTTK